MPFVIYNKESTILARLKRDYYRTERAAKAALTRAHNDGQLNREDFAIADAKTFRESIEKKKIVHNLMSGMEMEISVNTPACCDPSTETYWSM